MGAQLSGIAESPWAWRRIYPRCLGTKPAQLLEISAPLQDRLRGKRTSKKEMHLTVLPDD
jgi:hypothetical protein